MVSFKDEGYILVLCLPQRVFPIVIKETYFYYNFNQATIPGIDFSSEGWYGLVPQMKLENNRFM